MSEKTKPEELFLERYNLSTSALERILGNLLLGRSIDYADLYFERTVTEKLLLNKGIIQEIGRNISQGVGVRALAGEKTGYAYSDEITVKQLEGAASSAKYIAEKTAGGIAKVSVPQRIYPSHDLYSLVIPPTSVSVEERTRLLSSIEEICRAYDSRIQQVSAALYIQEKNVLIVSRDGWMVGDSRPLISLWIECVALEGYKRGIGSSGGGGRKEYGVLLEGEWYKELAREAARRAILSLSAEDAPAGNMVVVLGPGWPGILLHEAIGHGLEGDFNRKKLSAFTEKLGRRVAADICTVVDDGTIPGRRGSLNMDDEGTPTRRNVLIDRGILVSYMQDRLNAKLMGTNPTGNGRRESYKFPPMPRMTNTFMLAGDVTPEDIIRSVKYGLYAVDFGGGQVDITNGKFVFSATEAYLIEDGRITKPVKGATLIGDGPTVLTKVSMVGNNLQLDAGMGTCGKDGQLVPVGVGIPTIKVDEMTVGGTQPIQGGIAQ